MRDRLLGLDVHDHDWVVVGATPADMEAAGFKPVGKDFPVFLHPRTQEEYALARTERKSGHGYKGFVVHAAPNVTLEEDLARRDLTINAMAETADGQVIDPFNGQQDLKDGILRHVSPAFVEDPVRILRLARFAARFGFRVAPETLNLMQQMVADGEVDHLVPERVWQELARGLMEDKPSRMLVVLRESGAQQRLLPEIDRLFGVPQRADYHPEVDTGLHTLMVLDEAARMKLPLAARWAALLHDLGKADTPADVLPRHIGHEHRGMVRVETLCERLRTPAECRDLALMSCREHGLIHTALTLRPETLLELFNRCDVWRRPERFELLLQCCLADARGRTGFEHCAYPQSGYLTHLLAAAAAVKTGDIALQQQDKSRIPDAIRKARLDAIRAAMQPYRSESP